ncbi:MAG: DUF2933 domain-containing protein, partial [Acidobacteria bacterium]|nr:DUF2933 domain-containing protein [Acidobacteriota bacterium]
MNILLENWFFLLIVAVCVGMHFFHGHGHGHGGSTNTADGTDEASHGVEGHLHHQPDSGRTGGA